ncbi:MAG TPA: prepilin-type N-terminal cleavage/methylation domain-containing protein [Pirellulales bacterium]|nr:prepilin-type N-terminal cleavage/methylation domain-containing protein [Pirellulales bacterium]
MRESNARAAETLPAKRRAAGITLIEVLVSIGVLAIGLLGAATMLPLAKYYSAEANTYDRAGTLGAQAYHDLQIRGYLGPKKWIDPQGAFTFTNQSIMVIDPLAITYAESTYASTTSTQNLAPVFFPAIPSNNPNPPISGAPICFRTTVDITNNWPDSAPQPKSVSGGVSMPFAMADRVFRSNDDLVFDIPGRPDLRPKTPTGSLSPDYNGDFSWIVTVSHSPTDLFNAANMQRFRCSVVVLKKRDLNLNPGDWPAPPLGKKPPPERIVLADFINPPAYMGGLSPPPSRALPVYPDAALNLRTTSSVGATNWLDGLRANQYIMLSANYIVTFPGSSVKTFPVADWYRIVSAGEAAQVSGGIASRQVVVTGTDWPATSTLGGTPIWIDADGTAGAPNGVDTVFCTIVDGAVAVYDDVITLDNSLMRD